jgi:hypothetical protein
MTNKLSTKAPLDRFPYSRHASSRPYGPDLASGYYVFVQDEDGLIWVLPETEGHLHPKILGNSTAVAAAGGLSIDENNTIVELDNYSGTFQFGPEIFPQVRAALESQGGKIADNAEKPHEYS